MTGSGGQSGGTNIVVNGDFSSGSGSWGIPYMMGQVNQSVTNGQFCVTLGAASVATIGAFDYYAAFEASFVVFYLFPVAIAVVTVRLVSSAPGLPV